MLFRSPGGYLVLDDANREGMEKEYVEVWQAAYGDAIDPILLEGIGNGLWVIEKLDDCAPRYSRRGLVKTALKTARNFSRYLSRQEE